MLEVVNEEIQGPCKVLRFPERGGYGAGEREGPGRCLHFLLFQFF